jgi:DNA topoisomerase-1
MAKRAATKTSKTPTKTSKTAAKAAGKTAGKGSATEAPFDAAVEAKPVAAAGGGGGRAGKSRGKMQVFTPGSAKGKDLVIVESPSKAKTINKYLGPGFVVLASIGHVRDLPSKNPKGVKSPVPGVDLEHDFAPTYVISDGKDRVIGDLKRAAKEVSTTGGNVWFATDLDREGEAIAWHLAQELGIPASSAKRVMFAAITKAEIDRAFANPHPIDEDRVNAQQARRILDRIVGYQVSPLLWKKVARGLSAGRVQSVATRLVVDREREIRAFVPDEYWEVEGLFTPEMAKAVGLSEQFERFMAQRDEKKNGPTVRAQTAWLSEHGSFRAKLVEVGGEKFEIASSKSVKIEDLTPRAVEVAKLAGLTNIKTGLREDADGRGPAKFVRSVSGSVAPAAKYVITAIDVKRTSVRPTPPFITSTLQQSASSRMGFGAQRTMRAAQQLYEGVDIPGEGPVGLITYMRTDSTHLSREAIEAARGFIEKNYGSKYLPEKPNFFSSSNKDAQEAHEAIRPTNPEYTPARVRRALSDDQFRLYSMIWERFVACQMVPAQWDNTAITIKGGTDTSKACTFRATGRVLAFDGFYKATGVPQSATEQTLPALKEAQPVAPISFDVEQKFTSPPPRYSEASLIKVLEEEGIGRPSTYASIITTIQDRSYVEKLEGRLYATDLGQVVTDKLMEGFPDIMDLGYTREMETQLDKVEEEHLDWIDMLRKFYGPFKKSLANAEDRMKHAKAETQPAPKEYVCPTCAKEGRGGAVALVYRFGKNGRFLSCSKYPECTYACPVDRDGKPRPAAETVDVACIKCGNAMTKRVGKFGPFLGCSQYNNKEAPCDGLLNLDKKGRVEAPSPKPLLTDLPCPTCESPMNLRTGLRGPWLGCSRFPKCRGRGKWNEVPEAKRKELEAALEKQLTANPTPIVKTMSGIALTDANGKALATAPMVKTGAEAAEAGAETFETVAEEMGV